MPRAVKRLMQRTATAASTFSRSKVRERTYNESWLIERHGHRSPAQFRRDRMDAVPLAA